MNIDPTKRDISAVPPRMPEHIKAFEQAMTHQNAAQEPAAPPASTATPAKGAEPKETSEDREKRLWETVGVPSEDHGEAVHQYSTVMNPERKTPDFMVTPGFKWPYTAGDQVTKITPDTHGAVGLFTTVNNAAHASLQAQGSQIDTEVNIGDMVDKSVPGDGGYAANVGEMMKSVLYLPQTHGVSLVTIPGNHEDGILALTSPQLTRSLDGFGDRQIQTERTGGARDMEMIQTHALVVSSRARYAGKTFPEMNINVTEEMAALQPFVQTVDGKKGWINAPATLSNEIYNSLQTKVLAGMAQYDPKVHEYFTNQRPAYIQIGDYLIAHAGMRPRVPLEQQTAYDPMWIRLPFTRSFPDYGGPIVAGHNIHPFPTVHLGIDRGGMQEDTRVFGGTAPPAPGGGDYVGARFQIDTGTGATKWDQHTQLVLGPDDRVRFAIKPKGETEVKFLDMRDAVDQGHVKLVIHEREGTGDAAQTRRTG